MTEVVKPDRTKWPDSLDGCPPNMDLSHRRSSEPPYFIQECIPIPKEPQCPPGQSAQKLKILGKTSWQCLAEQPTLNPAPVQFDETNVVVTISVIIIILTAAAVTKMSKKVRQIFMVMFAGGVAAFFISYAFERSNYYIDRPIMFGIGVFVALGAWFAYREFFISRDR